MESTIIQATNRIIPGRSMVRYGADIKSENERRGWYIVTAQANGMFLGHAVRLAKGKWTTTPESRFYPGPFTTLKAAAMSLVDHHMVGDWENLVNREGFPGSTFYVQPQVTLPGVMGMLARPSIYLDVSLRLAIKISSEELFEWQDDIAVWLPILGELGSAVVFMGDLREIEVYRAGGLIVLKNVRSGASIAIHEAPRPIGY